MLLTIIATIMMLNIFSGQAKEPVVRPATQANRFYVGDPKQLSMEVDGYLKLHGECTAYDNVAALIVPNAGY